ncbi:hypothetical protein OHS70_08680 [Streptomyces sp. NBC_00390]|uniref:hypothetical protein n=1 Tax=Streptomyces sp. NBC_00390 TaxID=2975736 RepID=UPI002E22E517
MTLSWPDLVRAAAEESTAVLEKGADQNWARRAGDLDWSGRETLSYIALGVVGYAGLLIARPTDRYITLFSSIDSHAPVPAALEGIRGLPCAVGQGSHCVRSRFGFASGSLRNPLSPLIGRAVTCANQPLLGGWPGLL